MEKSEKFQRKKIEIAEAGYLNDNCWLVKSLNYAPYKRCHYCGLKFHNCLFLHYQIISLFLIVLFFTLSLLTAGAISEMVIASVFTLVVVYGYFFNKNTDKLFRANFAQKKSNGALKELTEKLEEKVDEQTKEIKEAYKKVKKAYEVEKKARGALEETAKEREKLTEKFQIVAIQSLAFKQSAEEMAQREKTLRQKAERVAVHETSLRKKTERLVHAREQFLLSSQHYFRTPLNGIRGFLELALEEETRKTLPGEVEKWLENARKGAEDLRKRIEESLDITQFELKREVLDLEDARVEELIKEAAKSLENQARQKGLHLKFNFPKFPLPQIKLDAKRMREVFSNLIDNAVKHTLKGGITINLKKKEAKDKNSLVIAISDTGIGIRKEDLNYIGTVPFQRGRDSQRLSPLGRGIGLYLSRLIVEAHQSKLWVESKGPGKGSTFYVELPLS